MLLYLYVIAWVVMMVICLRVLIVLHRRGRTLALPRVLPDDAEGFLSTEFLFQVANPKRLNTIRSTTRGKERLDVVEEESEENGGVVGTLTVCVDPRGVIALRDGHHRLLYALGNGVEFLPVAILQSRGIRSHGRPISEVLPLLLRDRRVSEPETE